MTSVSDSIAIMLYQLSYESTQLGALVNSLGSYVPVKDSINEIKLNNVCLECWVETKAGVSITSEIAVHDSPLKEAVWQVYDSIFSENQGKLAGGVRQSRRRYTAGNRLLLKPLRRRDVIPCMYLDNLTKDNNNIIIVSCMYQVHCSCNGILLKQESPKRPHVWPHNTMNTNGQRLDFEMKYCFRPN